MTKQEDDKRRYQLNKEKYKERNKKWREKNPNYYKEHKDKLRAYQKKWIEENPNYYKDYNKTPERKFKRKLYRRKTKRIRNLKRILKRYNLTIKEYKQITSKCCLCGFNKYRVDVHHIKKGNNKNNLIGLCPNCHMGYHRGKITLKQNSI